MIHTLLYAKKLIAIGMPREQAEAQVEIIAELVEDHLVTKADFKELEHKMVQMEQRLTIKLGLMMAASIGIVATIISLNK